MSHEQSHALPMRSPLRRRFALVFNARAGFALPRLLDGVLADLRAGGAEVFQLPTRSAEEAANRVADAAARQTCDAVIAAGGDGTFRAVATGAAGTALAVGLVPLGTGNVLGHELALTKRSGLIADTLLRGPILEARGGLANGAPFFLMVGAGFDGQVIAQLNYRTKRMIGRAAFTAPVLKTLWRGADPFDVVVDGMAMTASWVIVTRAAHYGGSFELTRATGIGRDAMIAVVFDAATRRDLVQAALALPLGRLIDPTRRPKYVSVVNASRVELGFRNPVAVEIDGDAAGPSPVVIEAAGPRVSLIVPPDYAARLSVA